MSDDRGGDSLREEIAFIKNALEEGRSYARMRSADIAVWGAAIAAGYFGTYAHVIHLWSVDPRLIWYVPVGLAWVFSLRAAIPRLLRRETQVMSSPMVRTLRSIWLGYGLTAMTLAVLASSDTHHPDWFDTVTAAMLGLCFFVSGTVSGIGWLRGLAFGWWAAAAVLFIMRDQPEQLVAGGVFMLALLFLPGLVLWLRRP
ncbi:MAG TPA: hypothetical protein VGN05_11650 [Parvibaculum sp.]